MAYFSIIIPVYNVASYLRECLDSVLAQTFTDWEAICVDDGSTDGSGAILDEYAEKDKRFRVIHQSNAGVSATRNAALDVANGEWILFLDADDIYASYIMSCCSKVVASSIDTEIVCFKRIDFCEDTNPYWPDVNESLFKINIRNYEIIKLVQSFNVPSSFFTCAYRKDIISDIRFRKYALGEDILFLYSVLDEASSITFTNVIGYGYRQRQGSVSHSKDNPCFLRDTLRWRCEVLNMIERSTKRYDKRIVNSHVNAIAENSINRFIKFNEIDQSQLFSDVFNALKIITGNSSSSGFQKYRANIIIRFPFKWIMLVLCVLPLWLKRKGFHR